MSEINPFTMLWSQLYLDAKSICTHPVISVSFILPLTFVDWDLLLSPSKTETSICLNLGTKYLLLEILMFLMNVLKHELFCTTSKLIGIGTIQIMKE